MAQTMGAAIEGVAGPEFDRRVGLVTEPMEAKPVDPAVAAAFANTRPADLLLMARKVAKMADVSLHDAEDAVSEAFERLLLERPELFTECPTGWKGLAYAYAENQARRDAYLTHILPVFSLEGGTRDTSAGTGDVNDDERHDVRPCVAYTKAGVDEEARYVGPPKPRKPWTRTQILGALQRYRDDHGRSPRPRDLTRENGLPQERTINRHFKSVTDALIEAGVPVEHTENRAPWTAEDAAEECARFCLREGHWPSHLESRRLPPGTLPKDAAMRRFFGGSSMAAVQAGAERILGGRFPKRLPPWIPTQERRAMLARLALGTAA